MAVVTDKTSVNRKAQLKINTAGSGLGPTYTAMRGLTNVTPNFDPHTQTYATYDSVWDKNEVTGQGFTLTFEGMRYSDDAAQNALTATVGKIGQEACVMAQFVSDTEQKTFTGLFAVKLTEFAGGGDPNGLAVIKGELILNGELTIEPIEAA